MRTSTERYQHVREKAALEREARAKRRKRTAVAVSVAAACALLLSTGLTLFLPYRVGGVDISDFAGSEYYPLIQEIKSLAFSERTTNNFAEWGLQDFFGGGKQMGEEGWGTIPDADNAPGSADSSGNGSYQEVTNNQTDGVVEGDLFKRTDRYVWYLSETSSDFNGDGRASVRLILSVYPIAGESARSLSDFAIDPEAGTEFYGNFREMFLSEDASTVTVLCPCYLTKTKLRSTAVISVDVSAPDAPKELSRIYLSGNYVSSRVTRDRLLIFSNLNVYSPDFGNPATYLPLAGPLGGMTPLSMEDIVLPENPEFLQYTFVTELDEKTHEINDSIAFFSVTGDAYVSGNNFFTYRTVPGEIEEDGAKYSARMTEVYAASFTDGLDLLGHFSVEGTVANRYSLDEKDGVLRMFTTSIRFPVQNSAHSGVWTWTESLSQCNLFCIRLEDFSAVAQTLDFAPAGESVQSVRFDGDKAYVCTAEIVVITDPVFEFDLSDYANITFKDTGTIPGYSLNLAKFYGGTMLGIGFGETRGDLKIEVYAATDSSVTPLSAYIRENADFSANFKDYFIDAEHGLVGLFLMSYGENGLRQEYTLLRFDGYELVELARIEGVGYESRAFYADGIVYVLGYDLMQAISVG